MPIDADGNFTGNLFTLLNPYGLLGGLAVVALCCTYGAIFVALKTTGDIRARGARALAGRIGVAAVVLGATFLVWTMLVHSDALVWAFGLLTAVALLGGLYANLKGREGWAFGLLGAHDGRRGGDAVRRALPERHALDDRTRPTASRSRTPARRPTR